MKQLEQFEYMNERLRNLCQKLLEMQEDVTLSPRRKKAVDSLSSKIQSFLDNQKDMSRMRQIYNEMIHSLKCLKKEVKIRRERLVIAAREELEKAKESVSKISIGNAYSVENILKAERLVLDRMYVQCLRESREVSGARNILQQNTVTMRKKEESLMLALRLFLEPVEKVPLVHR